MPTLKCLPFVFLLLAPGAALAAAPASGEADDPAELDAVHVRAARAEENAAVGSIDGQPWLRTPVSVDIIDRARLDLRQPRSLTEVLEADASASDSYAPGGYYQNASLRGFPLDLSGSYRLNGLVTAGQQRLALENKQAVQILKGVAGIEAGVLAPGGLVNFVSKRPEAVRRVDLGTDSHGSRAVALDWGAWLTPSFGLRTNLTWGQPRSAVDHADGRRNFYAIAADWLPGDALSLQLDADWQTSAQNSVSGYQLLGGTELPPRPQPTWMLGHQPWQEPVRMHSGNATARLGWQLAEHWRTELAAGLSRSEIDDNIAFAWGCYATPACADGSYPGNYFAPDGSYDIYDFRSPGDLRRNEELRLLLHGSFDTGPLRHALSAGPEWLRVRNAQSPWVNELVGSGHIDQREPPVFAPSPLQPGPRTPRLDHRQRALLLQDRVRLGESLELLLALRHARLDERTWGDGGVPGRALRESRTLPQLALSWHASEATTAWLSHARGITLGSEAPFWTSNAGAFLAPLVARQWEAGVKHEAASGLQASAALFRISRPFQFALEDASEAGATFVERGRARHRGLELALRGPVTDALRLDASLSWLDAAAHGTGSAAREGRQIVGIPRLQVATLADWQPSPRTGLHLIGIWRHVGARNATADGATRVGSADIVDLGLRWQGNVGGQALDAELLVSNATNRRWWRDLSSEYLGDHYLFPGMPRELRVRLGWSF